MIDELTLLREAWQDDQVPAPASQARARAALVARARRTVPAGRSRPRLRLAVAGLAAVAAVAGVVWYQGGRTVPTHSSPAPVTVTPVLEHAALVAATRPFTAPRPDQWVYLDVRTLAGTDVRTWRSVDGRKMAGYESGALEVHTLPTRGVMIPPVDYATLAALPRQPQALLDWAHGLADRPPQGPLTGERLDATTFDLLVVVLRDNVLPPDLEAAIFRAIAAVPDVTQASDPVVVDGRPVLAPGRVSNGWLREEILLDPQTYEVVGDRAVAVADHTGLSDPGVTTSVKRGDLVRQSIRTAAKIVDAPGQE